MAFTRRGVRALALAFALSLLSASFGHAQTPTARACTVRVTLLQVNDVYRFTPADRGAAGGLARISTLRKQIIKESPNTIFLLAGDTISPSVESITYKGKQMIDAWNQIGLDYSVFGNHEFDFGDTTLLERMKESNFKWLGANVVSEKTGQTFGATPLFDVRDFGGVKVGIFGITLPETKATSKPGADTIFNDPCATANRIVPQIRAAGAMAVVALTHLSLAQDKQLARCAPGIDVIIGGHEHTLLESSSAGTPIFKMTADARQLGRIDLNIDPALGKVESIDWKVIPVTDKTADDPDFASVTKKYADLLTKLDTPVGRTDVELDARSAANRSQETNVADFIADAFRREAGADVALVNGGSIRADDVLPVGDLTLRDVLSILPFGGDIVKIEVTGETLLQALEHGVAATAPGAEPGRFPQVSGLSYTFDASRLPGTRITAVTIGGAKLDPKKTYTLATSAFVAGGGDEYAMLKGGKNLLDKKLTDSDVLRRAIADAKVIAPKTDGRIKRLDTPADATKPCAPKASTAAPGGR